MDTEELYTLNIQIHNQVEAVLFADTIYGAMRGLETFSQLITCNEVRELQIENAPVNIKDSPRFKHRGLLLDTSRNYYSVKSILRVLDAMAYNKLNVFHWHLLDATSFPFQSEKYPELWKNGAYSHSMVPSNVRASSDVAATLVPTVHIDLATAAASMQCQEAAHAPF